jgi:hypothetical protein
MTGVSQTLKRAGLILVLRLFNDAVTTAEVIQLLLNYDRHLSCCVFCGNHCLSSCEARLRPTDVVIRLFNDAV